MSYLVPVQRFIVRFFRLYLLYTIKMVKLRKRATEKKKSDVSSKKLKLNKKEKDESTSQNSSPDDIQNVNQVENKEDQEDPQTKLKLKKKEKDESISQNTSPDDIQNENEVENKEDQEDPQTKKIQPKETKANQEDLSTIEEVEDKDQMIHCSQCTTKDAIINNLRSAMKLAASNIQKALEGDNIVEECIEKDKRKQNSKKDDKREGKLQDKNDENIYLVHKEDPGAVKLVENFGLYIEDFEKENLEALTNTSLVARNILGKVYTTDYLRKSSLQGNVPGTVAMAARDVAALVAFVRQTQVNKNFTQKESDQSIRIILSKRLGEYRQGEHILKPIKKAT